MATAISKEHALMVVHAVGEAIKVAGSAGIPSGHLYAMLLGKMSLGDYEAIIRTLKNVGVVEERNYVLTWKDISK